MTLLSVADEGKVLTNEHGEDIGIVTEVDVETQVAYVEPEPGIAEAIIGSLGLGGADEDDLAIGADAVETVTDTEIRISTAK